MKLLKSSVSGELLGGLLQLLVRSSRMVMVSSTRFSLCFACGVYVRVLSAFALAHELVGEGCLDLLCAPWLVCELFEGEFEAWCDEGSPVVRGERVLASSEHGAGRGVLVGVGAVIGGCVALRWCLWRLRWLGWSVADF